MSFLEKRNPTFSNFSKQINNTMNSIKKIGKSKRTHTKPKPRTRRHTFNKLNKSLGNLKKNINKLGKFK